MLQKRVAYFIAFIAINNIVAFSFNLGAPYYLIMLTGLVFFLLKSRITYVNVYMLCFYFACMFSIFVNQIPSVFNPWSRFATFVLMTLLLSPFLGSPALYRFRNCAFKALQCLMQPVVVLSLIAYFAGISWGGRRDIAGITNQSMLLAPISANVILTGIFKLVGKRNIKIEKWYYIGIVACSFITLLLAASRTAIVGTLASGLVFFYVVNKNSLGRFLKRIIYIAIVFILSYPLWNTYTERLNYKNKGSMATGGIMSSRDVHWESRWEEFKSSPIFGIGFSSVDIKAKGATMDSVTGQVETGSSWLSFLSMTGILGMIAFCTLFIQAFIKTTRFIRKDKCYAAYLLSLIIFWTFHMVAEGYILGAGSFLFFNVWLLLGYIYAIDLNDRYKNEQG